MVPPEIVACVLSVMTDASALPLAPVLHGGHVLRVATYNIHKGVQGLGPLRRLEIHNLGLAVEQMDADLVCLQEVRRVNYREARRFAHWPSVPQANFLAPPGYEVIYRTNARTRHGEHGNALLSRWPVRGVNHRDVSDHRFEQRGLLHAEVDFHNRRIHVIVVHLGLIAGSRVRQVQQLESFIVQEIPPTDPLIVAGDFNDWGQRVTHMMAAQGLHELPAPPCAQAAMTASVAGTAHAVTSQFVRSTAQSLATFPSWLPVVQLDHVYARGLTPAGLYVPRGTIWRRMSDHLPLIAQFRL